jgi:hypothetical protein
MKAEMDGLTDAELDAVTGAGDSRVTISTKPPETCPKDPPPPSPPPTGHVGPWAPIWVS